MEKERKLNENNDIIKEKDEEIFKLKENRMTII